MVVLICLIVVWFIYSAYRINQKSKNGEFNPFDGGFFEYLGFIIGLGVIIVFFIVLSIKYLP